MYDIILAEKPQAFVEQANRVIKKKLLRCFAVLENSPRHGNNNIKPLTGEFSHYYRYRLGDWRVIYRIDEDAQQVTVISIAHRKDVYEQ